MWICDVVKAGFVWLVLLQLVCLNVAKPILCTGCLKEKWEKLLLHT